MKLPIPPLPIIPRMDDNGLFGPMACIIVSMNPPPPPPCGGGFRVWEGVGTFPGTLWSMNVLELEGTVVVFTPGPVGFGKTDGFMKWNVIAEMAKAPAKSTNGFDSPTPFGNSLR